RVLAQPAAQLESAVGLVAQPDVDDGEVRQARAERLLRLRPIGIAGGLESVAHECVAEICADGRFVLDDGDAAGHWNNVAQRHASTVRADRARARLACRRRPAARTLPESCPYASGSSLGTMPVGSVQSMQRGA